MDRKSQKQKFDDSLFWLDKANCHTIAIALLAVSSLLDFAEPAAEFLTLHKSYPQSELAAMCRERANLAVAGLGDVHEYWVRFSRQSSDDQGTLRFTELRGAQSLVNALPTATRSKVLAPVAGVDEHTGISEFQRWAAAGS